MKNAKRLFRKGGRFYMESLLDIFHPPMQNGHGKRAFHAERGRNGT